MRIEGVPVEHFEIAANVVEEIQSIYGPHGEGLTDIEVTITSEEEQGNEGLEGVAFAQVITVYGQGSTSRFITQDLGHHTVEYDFDESSLRIYGTGTQMFLDLAEAYTLMDLLNSVLTAWIGEQEESYRVDEGRSFQLCFAS